MNKIAIFNQIRNKPYHISTEGESGSACTEKSLQLIKELNKLGLQARLIVGFMKWSRLKLPEELTNIPHDDDSSHAFVEIKNDKNRWVYIDPTWNPELAVAGFPIAKWDGINETSIALNCHKILSAEESEEHMKQVDFKRDMKSNKIFYRAFNNYCDSFLERK